MGNVGSYDLGAANYLISQERTADFDKEGYWGYYGLPQFPGLGCV
jgi:hypothetical protein